MKIAKSLTELVGNTPLLELSAYARRHDLKAELVAKLEAFNPLSSAKRHVMLRLYPVPQDKNPSFWNVP